MRFDWKRATGEDGNPVFRIATHAHAKEVEKDRKRKMTDEAKKKRKDKKYRKSNDNSLKARSDYSQHDGSIEVRDVHQDIPEHYLQCHDDKFF